MSKGQDGYCLSGMMVREDCMEEVIYELAWKGSGLQTEMRRKSMPRGGAT